MACPLHVANIIASCAMVARTQDDDTVRWRLHGARRAFRRRKGRYGLDRQYPVAPPHVTRNTVYYGSHQSESTLNAIEHFLNMASSLDVWSKRVLHVFKVPF